MAPPGASRFTQLRKWLAPLVCGFVLLLIPVPAGLAPNAWHYFALFVAVVVALITEPMPGAAIGFIGVAAASSLMLVGDTPAEAMRWALSGFSNDTVWLIFAANMFALGYESTGLGRRIALLFVRTLGGRTLGLGYAIALTDLVLAPVMPSVTARSGGTIYPIVHSIPPLYGSHPHENPRRIGAYVMWTAFATSAVTSSMFLTAFAPNLLATDIVRRVAHVDISWGLWLRGVLPVGILLFAITPLLAYLLARPEVKSGSEVAVWAREELAKMGPISRREIIMVVLALAALGGWIGGSSLAESGDRCDGGHLADAAHGSDYLAGDCRQERSLGHAGVVRDAGGAGRGAQHGRFSDVVRAAFRGAGGRRDAGGGAHRLHRALFRRALPVRECHCADHGVAAGISAGRDFGSGSSRAAGRAAAELQPGTDGRDQPVRQRPRAHLLRRRVHQHARLLEDGRHHRRGLSGGAAGAGHSVRAGGDGIV